MSFWQRLIDRIRALFAARTPQPEPVDPEPTNPPDPEPPQPDPEPIVVISPWRLGPLTDSEPYPRHLFFWGESRDAGECGRMLQACGFGRGARVVVMAKSGRSPVGITARLVWHPVNEPPASTRAEQEERLRAVLTRIDRAAAEGFSVIAVDCEGIAAYHSAIREVGKRARWHGMRVIQAPKAYFDHLSGTNAEDAAVLNESADVCVGWIYNQHWTDLGWKGIIREWYRCGLRIQGVPMCDSGRRARDPGYNSEQDIIEIIRGCAECGLSVGIFNPALPDSKEELIEAARWYG